MWSHLQSSTSGARTVGRVVQIHKLTGEQEADRTIILKREELRDLIEYDNRAASFRRKKEKYQLGDLSGGVLAFLGPGPIHLRAHYILVSDGGELLVGADNVSFPGKAHITLYGSSYTTPLYPYGVKFLAVRNATISMNGWVPNVIFTHLATAARANDTDLVLVDPVDWRVGDEVVLCGGRFEGLIKQQEILNIRSINGTHLSVSPSLRYSYDIVKQFIKADWIILRPVIALLSRDIVVQGNLTDEYISHYQRCQQVGVSDISECHYDRSENILGSQDLGLVFVAQAYENQSNLIHISGVQFHHMGQAFNKPIGAINIIGNFPLFGMKLLHHNYITDKL
ncbi:fibrocystin-like [Rana temporaria]|uniref:fibrocystin-like n=1 Tax=Rana temporaria TaxID=8407 RepID=UPI001AAC6839|nr:fibrocystin-like [Rana temporaria]